MYHNIFSYVYAIGRVTVVIRKSSYSYSYITNYLLILFNFLVMKNKPFYFSCDQDVPERKMKEDIHEEPGTFVTLDPTFLDKENPKKIMIGI